MSIQKSLKKGFTLIELMVVIVIIGILAAIAIPKLFGMSAKAKAQEIGPAVGTWVKLQQAYKMEVGNFGFTKQISYKVPGPTGASSETAAVTDSTNNFMYNVAKVVFTGTSKFKTDVCNERSTWTATFTEGNDAPDEPTMAMSDETNCKALTPNFIFIGKAATTTP
jgi:prepilin-type N-terminal cleavage/methylation domain-containing protein